MYNLGGKLAKEKTKMLKPGVHFSALILQSGEKKTPCTTALVQLAFVLSTLPSTLPRGSRIAPDPHKPAVFLHSRKCLSLSRSPRRGSPQCLQHQQTGSLFQYSWRVFPSCPQQGCGCGAKGGAVHTFGSTYPPSSFRSPPPVHPSAGVQKAAKATPGELQKERRATGGNHASWRV